MVKRQTMMKKNHTSQKSNYIYIIINRLFRSVDDKCSANKQFYFSIKFQNVLIFICIVELDCCSWLGWSVFLKCYFEDSRNTRFNVKFYDDDDNNRV